MQKIGRNDSCSCGSGKKYKNCCLKKSDVRDSSAAGFTPTERASAVAKLFSFAASPKFSQDFEIGHRIFWGGRLEDQSPEKVRQLLTLPQVDTLYNSWRLFDLEIDDGATLADFFLASGFLLSAGERAYLERVRQTFVGLYEVEAVRYEEGLELVDLWSGTRLWVKEKLATHNIVKWDLIAARLMLMPNEDWVLETGGLHYPNSLKDTLLKEMRHRYQAFKRRLPGVDDTLLLKRLAPFLSHMWLDLVVFRPLPTIVTAEGDKFIFSEARFDIVDRPALGEALAECPELDEVKPGVLDWWEDAGRHRRSLGTIKVQDNHLLLQTTSHERADRGRSLLEGVAGTAIRYRVTSYQGVEQAVKEVERRAPRGTQKPIPPEVEDQLEREFKEEHYRTWPDLPVPALGGRTPREAARLRSQRDKLINLLKDMENREGHAGLQGHPAYDFTWIWKELGLKH